TGAPATSPEGTALTLGSTIDNSAGLTFNYAWAATKDGVPFASAASAGFVATPLPFTLRPDDDGVYAVSLTVTAADGRVGAAAATVTATNLPPVVTVSAPPASSPEGTPLTFTGTATDPGAADTLTYTWGVTKDGAAYAL